MRRFLPFFAVLGGAAIAMLVLLFGIEQAPAYVVSQLLSAPTG